MSEKSDYFDYVTEVLGIRSILQAPETRGAAPLLILVEDFSAYSSEEKDLLAKMISALKLDPKILRVSEESTGETGDKFTLYFQDKPGAENSAEKMFTYSPRVLLREPSLKKKAWDDLQKVIQIFTK